MAAVRAVCPAGPVGADSPTLLLVDPWLRANWGRTLSRVLSSFCSRASRRRSTCSFSLLSISSRRRSIEESNSLQTSGTMWLHLNLEFLNVKGLNSEAHWAFLEQQGFQIMLLMLLNHQNFCLIHQHGVQTEAGVPGPSTVSVLGFNGRKDPHSQHRASPSPTLNPAGPASLRPIKVETADWVSFTLTTKWICLTLLSLFFHPCF